jgi:hypothetical protein
MPRLFRVTELSPQGFYYETEQSIESAIGNENPVKLDAKMEIVADQGEWAT